MKQDEKPDWITEEQWKAVPSQGWWKDSNMMKESIEQSKPATVKEAKQIFSRFRSEKNWRQGE